MMTETQQTLQYKMVMAIITKENKEEKKQIYQQPRTESINIGPNLSKSPLLFSLCQNFNLREPQGPGISTGI